MVSAFDQNTQQSAQPPYFTINCVYTVFLNDLNKWATLLTLKSICSWRVLGLSYVVCFLLLLHTKAEFNTAVQDYSARARATRLTIQTEGGHWSFIITLISKKLQCWQQRLAKYNLTGVSAPGWPARQRARKKERERLERERDPVVFFLEIHVSSTHLKLLLAIKALILL